MGLALGQGSGLGLNPSVQVAGRRRDFRDE
jgi:hypothetical protein